ncbi:hypothetical protein [Eubacterium uniforme]|uniref:Uncharacterized protein n=1 Tax=Eubacterium uniforme TaxID=39495 RepID=A0A1T4VNT0_9FIRM|nr:hypothetical protein [Eubacterium uniforme]SKA66555.1 hypothetical protein SAMN02745111_01337 [Eubacterium uniforme]
MSAKDYFKKYLPYIIIYAVIAIVLIFKTISNQPKEEKRNKKELSLVTETNDNEKNKETNKDTTLATTIEFESETETVDYVEYKFRNKNLLNQHFEKHGKDMGFADAKAYEKAASDVVNNKSALHKTEEEDGDDIYYVESTNEFVVVSTDGYLRTYFNPDRGLDYFNRQ